MKRELVIGDIHGCAFTLEDLLLNKCKISHEDKIYFLGDYIDRGPRSKRVIDFILKLKEDKFDINCLFGNHELMMLESFDSSHSFNAWIKNGGIETLRSFEIESLNRLPEYYKNFFLGLDFYYVLEKYIIVHAGLNFSIDNPLEDKQAMVWTRNDTIDLKKTMGRKLIVGHTPFPLSKIHKSIRQNIIYLDGGCVYKGIRPDLGYLVALNITNDEFFIAENIE